MSKFFILNICSAIFLIIINLFFLHKEPLYKDEYLNKLIDFIDLNIEKESVIQTDYTIDSNYLWISPLIRSLTKRNIYFDDSFPFNFADSEEWLVRKKNILEIKKNILENNHNLAICLLKKHNINYFISTNQYKLKDYKNIIYSNDKYFIYKLENNLNCSVILNHKI
tara:strand:+ start:1119 stop:1619 length:501 start_codon:yes stop_codon:yes gene_type:complete